jgi:hypothetical protein
MKKAGPRNPTRAARATRAATEAALPPGLHAATIELASNDSYRVRLATGERVKARLDAGVDVALAEECLKHRRTVLVTAHPEGPTIVGAVQVAATARLETLRIEAGDIELCAGKSIVLRVGKSLITLDERGVVTMVGEKMSLRMANLIKMLSANVELP